MKAFSAKSSERNLKTTKKQVTYSQDPFNCNDHSGVQTYGQKTANPFQSGFESLKQFWSEGQAKVTQELPSGLFYPIRLSSEQARFRKGKLSYNLLPYLLLTESSEASSCNQKNQFKKANF